MNKPFNEVLIAYVNGDDFSIEKCRSKLLQFSPRKLETILNHPHFVSLKRIDKLVRLHEIVSAIKDKEENDPDFQSGYDEAMGIFNLLNSLK